MNEKPKGPGILLILAPIACCGLPLLLATGILSGFGAWLADGGIPIIIAVVISAVVFVYAWKRLGSTVANKSHSNDRSSTLATEAEANAKTEHRQP